jgi:hypothetical protein
LDVGAWNFRFEKRRMLELGVWSLSNPLRPRRRKAYDELLVPWPQKSTKSKHLRHGTDSLRRTSFRETLNFNIQKHAPFGVYWSLSDSISLELGTFRFEKRRIWSSSNPRNPRLKNCLREEVV